MSSLEALTEKIINDGKLQAEKIIKEAVSKNNKELQKEENKTQQECDIIIKDAKIKASEVYQQICCEKQMEIRDANLFAKQKNLDKVFMKALAQLKNLEITEYKELLHRVLERKDLSGCVIVMPDRFLSWKEELRVLLSDLTGKDSTFIQTEFRSLSGGLIIVKNGIEENYTFEAWINMMRQQMEGEVLDILYGEEIGS